MLRKLVFKKFIEYLSQEDLYTPLYVRYFHLLAAIQYPSDLDGKEVLDLGCGNGEFVSLLQLKNKISLGIDNLQRKINLAEKTSNYQKLLKADFSKPLLLVNKRFKIIIANSVLEHIKNLNIVFKNIDHLLDRKGKFIFTVPQKGWEKYLLCSGIEKDYGKRFNIFLGHKILWEKNEWKNFLQKQKFKIFTCREFNSRYSCFLFDILFHENNIKSLKKTLYTLYLNDNKLSKIYEGGSLYFEVGKTK